MEKTEVMDAQVLQAVQGKKENKKGRKKNWIVILLLLAVIAGAAILTYTLSPQEPKTRLQRDQEAIQGLIPDKSASEIADILGMTVDEGMVNVSIKRDPTFLDGGASGNINIQNVPANHYSFQVDLVLDATQETVYQSQLISPGYYVQSIALSKTLAEGDYPTTAVFRVYDVSGETDEQIATVKAAVTLHVLG